MSYSSEACQSAIAFGSVQAAKTRSGGALNVRRTVKECFSAAALSVIFSIVLHLLPGVGLFQISGQRIELLLPKTTVALDPFGGVLHGFGVQAASADAPVFLLAEQAGALEDAEVFGDSRQGHFKGCGEFADGQLAPGEASEDGPAGGVGEGAEGGVQLGAGLLNHKVKH